MLTRVVLKKFRCYESHEVEFRQVTIIVGKNNAGKSSLIEALRLVSLICKKFPNAIYKSPPRWTELAMTIKGIVPSLEGMEFSNRTIIYRDDPPPAIIDAYFLNGERITIYLNDLGEIFATIYNRVGENIISKTHAKTLELDKLSILPQITPLLENEKPLEVDRVMSHLSSTLASRHFRNQLSYLPQYFDAFAELAGKTWDGLRVVSLTPGSKLPEVPPLLMVQESGFTTEIGFMGHGLQMWLQTMWFLARSSSEDTIVLDEPDVYMHADLQRRLIRTVRGLFKQVIIATHSLEIMAEVGPDNILVVERSLEKSGFASNLPSLQSIIDSEIGSAHNIALARLWSARKVLLVEGEDTPILKSLQNILFPDSNEPFDGLPGFDIGGWGGWNSAKGSGRAYNNAVGERVLIYCIFDSDYHTAPEIKERMKEGIDSGVEMHIWEQKEIENYFIIPSVIHRVISKQSKTLSLTPSALEGKIEAICEELKEEIIDDYASEISKYYKHRNKIIDFMDNDKELSNETKNVMRVARKVVDQKWSKTPLGTIPGKTFLKKLNRWLTEEYKVSAGLKAIIKELRREEIHPEVVKVITAIERCTRF